MFNTLIHLTWLSKGGQTLAHRFEDATDWKISLKQNIAAETIKKPKLIIQGNKKEIT